MSSETSLYPRAIDVFVPKVNTTDGTDGDYIMAEHMNKVQNAIVAIQETLGINPQGDYINLAKRLEDIGQIRALSIPRIAIYSGDPIKVNNSTTAEEAARYFSYLSITILAGIDPYNTAIMNNSAIVIEKTHQLSPTSFYGAVDAGVRTSNLPLADISNIIDQWIDIGAEGIYLYNFGYDELVSRERQNQLIELVHNKGLRVIVSATNIDHIFSEDNINGYNPARAPISLGKEDGYLYTGYAVRGLYYQNAAELQELSEKMIAYRSATGVSMYALAHISNSDENERAKAFNYAQAVATLYSLDAFYAYEDLSTTDKLSLFRSIPLVGDYYDNNPVITISNNVATRMSGAGRISVNFYEHTYNYSQIKIPLSLIDIDGDNALIDAGKLKGSLPSSVAISDIINRINNAPLGTIVASKVDVDGTKTINAINQVASGPVKISADAIDKLSGAHIEEIVISVLADQLEAELMSGELDVNFRKLMAQLISAQNAYFATIIGETGTFAGLNAGIITSGIINTDLIGANTITSDKLSIVSNMGKDKWVGTIVMKNNPVSVPDPGPSNIYGLDVYRQIEALDGMNLVASDYIGSALQHYVVLWETTVFCSTDYNITSMFSANSYATLYVNGEKIASCGAGLSERFTMRLKAGLNKIQIYQDHTTETSCTVSIGVKLSSLARQTETLKDENGNPAPPTPIVRMDAYAERVTQITGDMIKTGTLSAEKIEASVIEAIRLAVGNVVGDTAAFKQMIADVITGQLINAANVRITSSASTDPNDRNTELLVIDKGGLYVSSKPKVNETDEYWPIDAKVIRLTKNGLAISSDGGRTWTTKLTGEGLHVTSAEVVSLEASKITAGNITTGGEITVGEKVSLTDDGINVKGGAGINVTTGTVQVTDGDAARVKMGLYDGENYGIEIITDNNGEQGYSIIMDKHGLRTTSGNFSIGADGNILIAGEIRANTGTIGGWSISSTSIHDSKGAIVMDSSIPAINVANGKAILGLYDNTDPDNPKYGIYAEDGVIGGLNITPEGIKALIPDPVNQTTYIQQYFINPDSISLTGDESLTINTGTMVIKDNGTTYLALGRLDDSVYGLRVDLDASSYIQLDQDGLRAFDGANYSLNISRDGNITIRGTIHATNGTLSNLTVTGNITAGDTIINSTGISGTGYSLTANGLVATKGSIAGWSITEKEIKDSTGNFVLDSETGQLRLANDNVVLRKEGSAKIGKLLIETDGSVVSDNFNIDSQGNVTMQGQVRATSGWFGSQADGVMIDSTGLAISGQGSITGTGFSLSNNGITMERGLISLGKNFIVTNDGTLTAKSGIIGGVTIRENSLAAGAVILNESGILVNVQSPIVINDNGIQSVNFSINADGSVSLKGNIIAESGIFNGTIQSQSGYFGTSANGVIINSTGLEVRGSGIIKAGQSIIGSNGISLGSDTSIVLKNTANEVVFSANNTGIYAIAGTVGGWQLSPDKLSSNNINLNSDGTITIGSLGQVVLSSAEGIKVATDKFVVDLEGNLTATSANIKGVIDAESGRIGNWYIKDGSIVDDEDEPHIIMAPTAINIDNQVIVGRYDGTNYGIKAGDTILNSSGITARQGTIGGWTISESTLSAENITLDSTGRITIGQNISIDGTFVDSHGRTGKLIVSNIEAVGGTIGGLTITNSSIESTYFRINSAGEISATNVNITGTIHADIGTFGTGPGRISASDEGIWNGRYVGDPLSTFWISSKTIPDPSDPTKTINAGSAFFKGTISVSAGSVIDGGTLAIEEGSIIAGNPTGAHIRMTFYPDSNVGGELYSQNEVGDVLFRVNKQGAYFMGDITARQGTIIGGLAVGPTNTVYLDGVTSAIYLYDRAGENAQRVVRLNNDGLYISQDGGITYEPALTGSGINADAIKDGVLRIDDSGTGASGILIRQWNETKNEYVENVHITPAGISVLNGAITVYSDTTGEILIGGGYLRVKGLDMGVVTSNNFIGNGNFNMVSDDYGVMQKNQGEVFLGRAQSTGGSISNPTYHYVGWPDYGERDPHTIYTFKINPDGVLNNWDPEDPDDPNKPNWARSSFNPQWSVVHPTLPYVIVPADADNFCTILDYEGNIIRQMKAWKGGLFGASFTPDGTRLVVCGDDIDRKRSPWDMVVFDTSDPDPNNWYRLGVIFVGEFPSKVVCDDKGYAYTTVSLDDTVYKLDIENLRVEKIMTMTDPRGMAVVPMPIDISHDYEYIYVGGVVSDFVYEIPTSMDVPLEQCRRFSTLPYPGNRGIIHDLRVLPDGNIAISLASTTDAAIAIINPRIEVVNEPVTFNTDTKQLSYEAPDMSKGFYVRSAPKGTEGVIEYVLGEDYTVDILNGHITRVEGGRIEKGQTVYIEYTGGGMITYIDHTMKDKLAIPEDATDEEKAAWNFFSSTTLNYHPYLPIIYVTVTNRCVISVLSYETGELVELQRIPCGSNPSGVSISKDGLRLYVPHHHYHTYPLGANRVWGYKSDDNFYATDDVFDTTQRYWHHNPSGIVTTGDGRYVWVANRATNRVIVVDTENWGNTTKWTYIENVGNKPYELRLNHSQTKIFVSNNDSDGMAEPDFVTIIDVATRQVEDRIYVSDYPMGMAISEDDRYLFVACKNTGLVQKINIASRRAIASRKIDGDPRYVHLVGNKLYVTCYDANKLYCLDANNLSIISVIECDMSPAQMESVGHKLYITNAGADTVMVIDTTTNTLMDRIEVGSKPRPIAYNKVKNILYVGNSGEGSVCIIDPTIDEVIEWCMTGDNPEYIAVSPDGERWYVTAHGPEDIVAYGEGTPYTGDAYVDGNGITHKYGAAYWMPSRSKWTRGIDNTLTSFSSVEFWPTAQLQGKQGYAHLTVMGMYDAFAQIEQDVYPLLNSSDGACEYHIETIDLPEGAERELKEDIADYSGIPSAEKRRVAVFDAFDPSIRYIENIDFVIDYDRKTISRLGNAIPPSRVRQNAGPLNGTTPVSLIPNGYKYNEIKVFPLNQTTSQYKEGKDYIINRENNTIARTENSSIPDGETVTVEYYYYIKVRYFYHPYKRNYEDVVLSADVYWRWPRPENQWVRMEIDELVPKPIYVDNDQIEPWQPILDFGKGYYNKLERRYEFYDSKGNLLQEIPWYKGLVYSGISNRAIYGTFTASAEPISGDVDNLKSLVSDVVLPPGEQYIELDIGSVYYITEIIVKHTTDGRTINNVRVEVSTDYKTWTVVYQDDEAPSEYTITFPKTYNGETYNGPMKIRFLRFYANGTSVSDENVWKQIKVMGDWKANTSYTFASNTLWDSEGVRESYLTFQGVGEAYKIRFDDPTLTTDPLSPMTPPAQRIRYRLYYIKPDGEHDIRGEVEVYDMFDEHKYNGLRSDMTPVEGEQYDYIYDYLTNTIWLTENSRIKPGQEVRAIYRHVQEDLSNLPLAIPYRDPVTGKEATRGSVAETDVTGAWIEWTFRNEYRCDFYVGWIADIGLGNIAIYLDGKLIYSISQNTAKIERFSQLYTNLMPGEHTIKFVQQQGRVNFDIIKLQDYQLYYRNSNLIASPSINPVELFDWYTTKLSPGAARKYLGRGAQITSGAYDTVQTDKITKIPNHQIPIKYRVRFKTTLEGRGEAVEGEGSYGGEASKNEFDFEKGSVMITSVTMEYGVNPTYWRMAPAADKYPGFTIESWDPNEPLHTGIQEHHIANGAITADKIKKFQITDLHIANDAAIQESKLALNHPTHPHANKEFLDSMEGWGSSGTSNLVARADHTHDSMDGDLVIKGRIKELGKPYIAHSRPLYGLAGDPQFQTNSYAWETLVSHYNLFGFAMPPTEEDMKRKYRLYCVYGDNITANDSVNAKIRIVTDEATPQVVYEWTLPYTAGSSSGRCDAYSGFFEVNNTGKNHIIQVRIQNSDNTYTGSGKEVGIEWLELIAYDIYEEA